GSYTYLERDSQGIPSPLYYASLLGLYHSVLDLIRNPCEVSLKLTDSQRPTANMVKHVVNMQGGKLGTALQAASYGGHEKTIELLFSKGDNVNMQGGRHGNALQAASNGGHEKVVELLLSKGADINIQYDYYGTALQAASYKGHEKIIELLLSKG